VGEITAADAQLIQAKTAVKLRNKQRAEEPDYTYDIIRWAVDVLGVPERTLRWRLDSQYKKHVWDGTVEPLVAMFEAIQDGQDCGVEGGTGTSKTFGAAIIVLWFLDTFENALVVTTAPKEKQLQMHIWAEISKMWPAFKKRRSGAQMITLQLRMLPGEDYWTAVAFPVGVGAKEESAVRARGFHAPHMLIITEETPGIHSAVMTAFENTCTAVHNMRLALGNPDSTMDELHKFCEQEDTVHVRISAYDYPNVVCKDPDIIPGGVTQESIDKRLKSLGRGSRIFMSHVRGICPEEGKDTLIRMQWIRDAVNREREPLLKGPTAIGVDVANSEDGDMGSWVLGYGAVVHEVHSQRCPDANEFGGSVVTLAKAQGVDETRVGMDSIGVGAGAVNEAKRLGMNVRKLDGSASPVKIKKSTEVFANLRSQMWWQARLDLQHARLSIPDDEELHNDLLMPQWELLRGKITLESKEKIKRRLGRSPDKGDAFVYWNWVRQDLGRTSGRSDTATL